MRKDSKQEPGEDLRMSEQESTVDEAEWEGMNLDNEDGLGAAAYSEATSHGNLLPTREELRNIKDANELFKSGSFKLQASALYRLSQHALIEVARSMRCFLMLDLIQIASKLSTNFYLIYMLSLCHSLPALRFTR